MVRAAQVSADDVEDTETPEPSLRETIEAARDEVIDTQVAERTPAEGTQAGAGDGPVRDDSGRFTRRDGAAAAEGERRQGAAAAVSQQAPAGAVAEPSGASQAAAQGGQPGAQVDATLAPQSWSAAAKAEWTKLAPTIRNEIARREADIHRTLSRQDEERSFGKQFSEVAQAHADVINRSGVAPIRIFQDFLGIMKVLGGNDANSKAALIRDVAIRNGLDLRALAGLPQQPQGAQNPNAPATPQAGAQGPGSVIPPAIATMANEWNQFKAQQQREAQERTQREQQQTLDEIVAFRAKPEARFFDAVKDQMVALLQVGAVATLEDAYNQAIWTRPDIRAVLQQEETAKAQTAEKARLRALAARQKGGSVRGGSGSVAAGAESGRSLREELQANFAEARSRV